MTGHGSAPDHLPPFTALGGDLGDARLAAGMIQLGLFSHKRAPCIEHQVVDGVRDNRLKRRR
jgi:hypothetical protein